MDLKITAVDIDVMEQLMQEENDGVSFGNGTARVYYTDGDEELTAKFTAMRTRVEQQTVAWLVEFARELTAELRSLRFPDNAC